MTKLIPRSVSSFLSRFVVKLTYYVWYSSSSLHYVRRAYLNDVPKFYLEHLKSHYTALCGRNTTCIQYLDMNPRNQQRTASPSIRQRLHWSGSLWNRCWKDSSCCPHFWPPHTPYPLTSWKFTFFGQCLKLVDISFPSFCIVIVAKCILMMFSVLNPQMKG